ncbi:MAG: hypothetical protein ACFCU8_18270 [Thermosynechococcaceae cyanobacterium]
MGTSHDTGEFACDSICYWWQHYGSIQYPKARSILILCDGGGAILRTSQRFTSAMRFKASCVGSCSLI